MRVVQILRLQALQVLRTKLPRGIQSARERLRADSARKNAKTVYERTVLIIMKVFCRYSIVDVNSGAPLVFGEKWKELDKLNVDYINDGTQGVFCKHTMFHRNLEICGKRCVILLFALHFRRRGTSFNCLTEVGFSLRISGRYVSTSPRDNKENFLDCLRGMGIVGC